MSDTNRDKELDKLEQSKDRLVSFVLKETGMKKNEGKDTIFITDYSFEDGKLNVSAQFEEMKSNFASTIQENKYDILTVISYLLVTIYTLYKFQLFIKSAIYMDIDILKFNQNIAILFYILPIVIWLISTSSNILSLTGYKVKLLYLTIILIATWLTMNSFYFTYNLFIPWVGSLKIEGYMTVNKLIGLAWLLTILPTVIVTSVVMVTVFKLINRPENKEMIRMFKAKHYLSFKNTSKFDYNLEIFRDDLTGKKVTIYEHDRWLPMNIIGASGTGKTSSTIEPIVNYDMNTKLRNEDMQKKLVAHWVNKGWAYLEKPFEDNEFSISYVKPNPGYEKKFNDTILRYRSAGITVMAPEDSLTDKVYNLGIAKGFKVNRIDARRNNDGTEKEGSIGFNPFYVSPLLEDWEKEKEIIKRATLFADVMQMIYEMSGKSDPYFTSINRIATTTIAITLMVTYPLVHNGKHPHPGVVQSILNNFDRVKIYYEKLKEIDRDNKYEVIKDVIKNDFLGDGREKFEDHSRGLRTQLNNFLMDPEIRRILCSENSIDLDKVLRDGEITVVNFELGDLGEINSPAFALFFSLSFQNAVLTRKGDEWTRLPHFWVIDEFPILVTPSFERNFVLFRKFRTSMITAMQTLDQLNKNPFLKYLKGIILNSSAHHIVFGRTNPDDGDLVSFLSGTIDKIVPTEGVTQTSLLNENPTMSMMSRYTINKEARITADQQRSLDFQEITYFITKDGRALPPRFGKVYFLSKRERRKRKRFKANWKVLFEEQTIVRVSQGERKEENIEYTAKNNNYDIVSSMLEVVESEVSISAEVGSSDNTEPITSTVTLEEKKEEKILTHTLPQNLEGKDTHTAEEIEEEEKEVKTVYTFKRTDF